MSQEFGNNGEKCPSFVALKIFLTCFKTCSLGSPTVAVSVRDIVLEGRWSHVHTLATVAGYVRRRLGQITSSRGIQDLN